MTKRERDSITREDVKRIKGDKVKVGVGLGSVKTDINRFWERMSHFNRTFY